MSNNSNKRAPFPEELISLRKLMPELRDILEKGKEDQWYAFVWLEEVRKTMVTCAISNNMDSVLDRGMVFRVQCGSLHFEKSTNILTEDNLRSLAKSFRQELEHKTLDTHQESYKPLSWDEELKTSLHSEFTEQLPQSLSANSEVHFGVRCEVLPEETTAEMLKQCASAVREQIFARAKEYTANNSDLPMLADAQVMVRQSVKNFVFVDREKNISQSLPMTLIYALGVTPTGHSNRTMIGGIGGLEIATLTPHDLDEAAVLPIKLSQAEKLTPGRYQIITGPDVTGVIAHEAFGHTQEGDTWMKGRSIAQNLRNDKVKVGNDQATILNNPALYTMDGSDYGTNGSYFFDHEGHLARSQTILDKGFLSTPMTDLASAQSLEVPRTANGKRESWRRPLMTRQTNTYFTAGEKTVEELIEMVDDGYLARYAHGGMEDPKGGSLTAGAAYFEEIKKGKLTGKVVLGPSGGHIELSDPVFTLLERIVAKSSSSHAEGTPEVTYGGCGKYHKELVDAGCGGPYILWESINCG